MAGEFVFYREGKEAGFIRNVNGRWTAGGAGIPILEQIRAGKRLHPRERRYMRLDEMDLLPEMYRNAYFMALPRKKSTKDFVDWVASAKHQSGAHNQDRHGWRFGGQATFGKLRQQAKNQPKEEWEEYKRRARGGQRRPQPDKNGEKPGKTAVSEQKPPPAPEKPQKSYKERQNALFEGEPDKKELLDVDSSSIVEIQTMPDGTRRIHKPVSGMVYWGEEDGVGHEFYRSRQKGADFHVAASDVSEHFGLNVVPVSDVRNQSLRSEMIEGAKTLGSMSTDKQVEAMMKNGDGEKLAFVDYLVGQRDGHGENYITDGDRVYGIDYNLAGSTGKQRGYAMAVGFLPRTQNSMGGRVEFTREFVDTIRSKKDSLRFSDYVHGSLAGHIRARMERFLKLAEPSGDSSYSVPMNLWTELSYVTAADNGIGSWDNDGWVDM